MRNAGEEVYKGPQNIPRPYTYKQELALFMRLKVVPPWPKQLGVEETLMLDGQHVWNL